MSKKVLGVIPARIGSTRVPGKMLADICGKPLIEWTILRTKEAKNIDTLVVATDSPEIALVAERLGVKAIMTPSELKTGTDRVAEAVEQFTDFEPDIVVNIWGDEPLYPASAIDEAIQLLLDDDELQVSGVADLIESEEMLNEPSIVKVLTDINNRVLCFTRSNVPFTHHEDAKFDPYHIIGAMPMRREFLKTFLELPQTPIEKKEGIEQMRILENGFTMKIVKGHYNNLGVNTPSELEQVRNIFKER
ncbi:MAG: 3-deoxy-manno-octulosonate cytidylyltransferase (CMP-KDO synthetase) [Candidatus Paceibacteria bacterium]|jgi:3-deoxy-manno-octulosonate cytidylyltransferase (CMP-KDO synthetase)